MSGQFQGMVVEEVEGLGHLLLNQATHQIDDVIRLVTSKLHGTHWEGQDRKQFEHDWTANYVHQLNSIKAALGQFGQHAMNEARQQREASNS